MADSMVQDEFVSRSESFIHWLKQNGTSISPKIDLADLRSRDAGRGVIAKEDIGEDEELFSIPRSSILTVENSTLPAELKETDDPWLSLIVAMIYEYHQGSTSTWQPYFDVLPEHFDTLMFWSDDELAALEGSAVTTKIGKKSANEAFGTQIFPKLKQHPEVFKLSDTSDEVLSSLCHRMGSTIMAYAFDLEKAGDAPGKSEEDGWEEDEEETEILPKGMVPLADMLNADADRNNAKLFYEEDKVVMKSIKPVSKGEELFNDYGPLPNADVMRRYGYVTSHYDKYDVVEISVDLIRQAAKEELKLKDDDLNARLSYLEEQGALDDAYDIAHASNEDGQFSDELCILLNTVVLPKPDVDKLQKKEKLPKPQLSPEAARLLYNICVRRRAMYKDEESEDVTMSNSGSDGTSSSVTSRRQKMARHVIQGEKEVLREAANTLQKIAEGDNKKRKADTFESDASQLRFSMKKQKG